MEITIRRAVKEDCPRLLELVQELAEFERAPKEVTVTLEHFMESGFGKSPVWWAFVARLTPGPPPQVERGESTSERTESTSEMIVGFALYYIRYSTWKGQAMYLEDILVTNELRGKGVGKLLFDRLVEEAREKKFNRIIWQVLDWNEAAINFYKKYNVDFDKGWLNCSMYV